MSLLFLPIPNYKQSDALTELIQKNRGVDNPLETPLGLCVKATLQTTALLGITYLFFSLPWVSWVGNSAGILAAAPAMDFSWAAGALFASNLVAETINRKSSCAKIHSLMYKAFLASLLIANIFSVCTTPFSYLNVATLLMLNIHATFEVFANKAFDRCLNNLPNPQQRLVLNDMARDSFQPASLPCSKLYACKMLHSLAWATLYMFAPVPTHPQKAALHAALFVQWAALSIKNTTFFFSSITLSPPKENVISN